MLRLGSIVMPEMAASISPDCTADSSSPKGFSTSTSSTSRIIASMRARSASSPMIAPDRVRIFSGG